MDEKPRFFPAVLELEHLHFFSPREQMWGVEEGRRIWSLPKDAADVELDFWDQFMKHQNCTVHQAVEHYFWEPINQSKSHQIKRK